VLAVESAADGIAAHPSDAWTGSGDMGNEDICTRTAFAWSSAHRVRAEHTRLRQSAEDESETVRFRQAYIACSDAACRFEPLDASERRRALDPHAQSAYWSAKAAPGCQWPGAASNHSGALEDEMSA